MKNPLNWKIGAKKRWSGRKVCLKGGCKNFLDVKGEGRKMVGWNGGEGKWIRIEEIQIQGKKKGEEDKKNPTEKYRRKK